MPFQFGGADIILLAFVVAVPLGIVWSLYRVVRRAARAGIRDAHREESDPRA
jgi:cbb3-type cytochrome oxidase subunit 3